MSIKKVNAGDQCRKAEIEKTPTRLVVLISGSGTNLQAILDASIERRIHAVVAGVISNKSNAYGLERARLAGVPTQCYIREKNNDRRVYDSHLSERVKSYQPDWVVLAGWLRILSMEFLRHFHGRVINLHPALPGTFPGTNAIERAYSAWQRGEIVQTGVMVHLVPDEGVDDGPVLSKEVVPIEMGDTLEELEARIHTVEHTLLVKTLQKLIEGDLSPISLGA